MEGELRPSKKLLKDGLRHLVVPTFLPMDNSANGLHFIGQFRDSNAYCYVSALWVGTLPYSHYVIRSFPLCGVRVLHPAQNDQTG